MCSPAPADREPMTTARWAHPPGPIVRLPDEGMYRLASRALRGGHELRDCFEESRRDGFPEMAPKVHRWRIARRDHGPDRPPPRRTHRRRHSNRLLEESGYLRWASSARSATAARALCSTCARCSSSRPVRARPCLAGSGILYVTSTRSSTPSSPSVRPRRRRRALKPSRS